MWIRSDSFEDGADIPARNAFCVVDTVQHASFSSNLSPQLEWGDVPAGTASFALLAIDVDVPTHGDDVNQEGREVPPTLARTNFTHWLLVDIPSKDRHIGEGVYSDTVQAGGKPGVVGRPREGVNDYTGWFATDPHMAGTYFGYDGPCPPWNDSIIHHYVFTLLALDVEELDLPPSFTADDVHTAVHGHILGEAAMTGTYTLNPRLI